VARRVHLLLQRGVRRHAPDHRDDAYAERARRLQRVMNQRFEGCLLERRAEMADGRRVQRVVGVQAFHLAAHGGFQPAVAEVPALYFGAGESERGRVALSRTAVNLGSARVAQPKQPRGLVERLANRVVQRLPQQ
jgi:hypothetical protein